VSVCHERSVVDLARIRQSGLANRIVLLGASNLTLPLDLVIRLMQQRCGGPSDVLIAAGHGRSFGKFSRVLIRGLPGIATSGLWRHLEAAPGLPTRALVTDIGNDIAYGYMPQQILEWVECCVERLQRCSAQIVVTNLPLASIERVSDRHFFVVRSIFFPFSGVTRTEVMDRARAVHGGLREMARRRNFELCEQDASWFGPDIIHILYWKRRQAYAKICERFPGAGGQPARRGRSSAYAGSRGRPRFACQTILGRERRWPQPSAQLSDGSLVSLY
jgi:hypothetical protein